MMKEPSKRGKGPAMMGSMDSSRAGTVSFEAADILEVMTVRDFILDSALGARPMAEMDMVMCWLVQRIQILLVDSTSLGTCRRGAARMLVLRV